MAVGACCLLMIPFSASPGLEIWERSILVLISSVSTRPGRVEGGSKPALHWRYGDGHAPCPLRGLRENWNGSSSL